MLFDNILWIVKKYQKQHWIEWVFTKFSVSLGYIDKKKCYKQVMWQWFKKICKCLNDEMKKCSCILFTNN